MSLESWRFEFVRPAEGQRCEMCGAESQNVYALSPIGGWRTCPWKFACWECADRHVIDTQRPLLAAAGRALPHRQQRRELHLREHRVTRWALQQMLREEATV